MKSQIFDKMINNVFNNKIDRLGIYNKEFV